MFDSDFYHWRLAFGLHRPRRVRKSKACLHEYCAERHLRMARDLGRPDYVEGPGFSDPPGARMVIRGYEKPYGPFSRGHWRYVRLAMREAFLAEWHRALGSTYETTEGGRPMTLITGLTS